MAHKIDKQKLGFLLGFIAPPLTFVIIYFISFPDLSVAQYIDHLRLHSVFLKVVSLCVVPNLALFFLFIWKNYLLAARGVLTATMIYAVVVFVIYFLRS